jgi:hypothetical protein
MRLIRTHKASLSKLITNINTMAVKQGRMLNYFISKDLTIQGKRTHAGILRWLLHNPSTAIGIVEGGFKTISAKPSVNAKHS